VSGSRELGRTGSAERSDSIPRQILFKVAPTPKKEGSTAVVGNKNWGEARGFSDGVFLIDFFNGCVNINPNIQGVLIDSILSGD
jgi:hypothetical protein